MTLERVQSGLRSFAWRVRAHGERHALLWLISFLGTLGSASFLGPGTQVPPALLLLPLCSPMQSVLGDRRKTHLAFFLAFGLLLFFFGTHPVVGPRELALRFNLAGVICVSELFTLGHGSIQRALERRLATQQARIEARLTERAQLTSALQSAVGRAVQSMQRAAEPAAGSLPTLREQQQQLEQVLTSARVALQPDSSAEDVRRDTLPNFNLRLAHWLTWISVGHTTYILLRVLFTARGALVPTLVVLVCDVVAGAFLVMRPRDYVPVIVAVWLVAALSICAAFGYWGFSQPPPNLILVPTLAYAPALIGGLWMHGGFALINFSTITFIGWMGAADRLDGALHLAAVGLCGAGLQLAWYLFEDRVRASLLAVEERARELRRLDVFRGRVCGTLFHDVANLVQAQGMVVTLCEKKGSVALTDVQLLRGLQERLVALVSAVLHVLERSEPVPTDRVVATSVQQALWDIEQVFGHRLQQKSLLLKVLAPELQVLAAPELLRDSVLANLISNAIKFSPPGATIEVEARREGPDVEISVRDEGPGFPSELLQRIRAGERVHSTPGTANELGLGLGLTLVAEHLRRMGGRLALRARDEGGSEVAVLLRAA
ncbi:MAG: ATP-binding protein [Myxococcales bacterium]